MFDLFIELLQLTLGNRTSLSRIPSDKEWYELYSLCKKQSVATFVFTALEGLSKAGQKPPVSLIYAWIGLSEQVKAQNAKMNKEAARLTCLFGETGHRTAILKGQANARLYPQPWTRQSGDIDIWVDGGKKNVIETTRKLGLLKGEIAKYQCGEDATLTNYHIHLPKNENGIDVEIHFLPSLGNMNPFTNKRLQTVLEQELRKGGSQSEEGFFVPSVRFALLMQLAHIQGHLIREGVGMRQIVDYYYLLCSCKGGVNYFKINEINVLGLKHIAGAMMWVLHDKLGLDEKYMIAPIDEKRGKMLLQTIKDGGNFGHHYTTSGKRGSWQKIIAKHKRRLQMLKFDAPEAICTELSYASFFIKSIPERIKRRVWSLE